MKIHLKILVTSRVKLEKPIKRVTGARGRGGRSIHNGMATTTRTNLQGKDGCNYDRLNNRQISIPEDVTSEPKEFKVIGARR